MLSAQDPDSVSVDLQAPVGVMTVLIRGKVSPRTPAIVGLLATNRTDQEPRGWRLTEGVVNAHSPGHALLTLNVGEDLGRVLEGNRSLTQGVGNSEEVDEAEVKRSRLVWRSSSIRCGTKTYRTTGTIREPLKALFSDPHMARPAARRKMHMKGKVWIVVH